MNTPYIYVAWLTFCAFALQSTLAILGGQVAIAQAALGWAVISAGCFIAGAIKERDK